MARNLNLNDWNHNRSCSNPGLVETENQKSRESIPIKYVSSISIVCEIFISNPITKLMLSEVNKMLFLYLTVYDILHIREIIFIITKTKKISKIYNDTEKTEPHYTTPCS